MFNPALPKTVTHTAAAAGRRSSGSLIPRKRVSGAVLADFARGLAVMISARVPLVDALKTAEGQIRNRTLAEAVTDVRNRIERGSSLYAGLSAHPDVFGPLFAGAAHTGEAGGTLDDVLLRLATFLEKAAALRQKVRMALLYPAIILLVASAAVVFMLAVIVPTFAAMYADFGAELPGPTQAVLTLSNLITRHIGLLIAAGAAAALLVTRVRGHHAVRERLDDYKLRLPLIGTLLARSETARLCRTLGTLMKSGVSLEEALSVTGQTCENAAFRRLTEAMRKSAVRGQPLSKPLATATFLPPMVSQMLRVGEETAAMPDMLLHVADHYETDLDRLLDGLSSAIEPVLIVLIGLIVGGLLVALYLPIFDLATTALIE